MSFFSKIAAPLIGALVLMGASERAAYAQDIILTIKGNVKAATERHYSLKDLEAFPRHEIKTSTPWHDKVMHFEGVLLKDLLEDAGSLGDEFRVIALNDYSALIPVSDTKAYDPILAYKLDGAYMGIEDKGPLFIIYPFDEKSETQVEIYHARSVWQARTIVIK